ncbi:F0F1 ATP synthase subunit C [bacterium]|nr:MAG: F0F1 ATP synthase subunit C [bacterium]
MFKRILFSVALVAMAMPAFAADGAATDMTKGIIALAAGITIATAVAFGALGQSRGLSAALEGIARNPAASGKLVTPMIIGLALIESLVIYALVIAFMIVGKM